MHDHGSHKEEAPKGIPRLALIGNPNVGKSVIFGYLTGKYVTVSNYPGTTVEITTGKAFINKKEYVVIDSPGVNSLLPMSEDEKVTRDILLNEDIETLIQVIDTKNLRRGLLITLQLAEMEVPFITALNLYDEAGSRGIHVDSEKLSGIIGTEAVPTVATQRKGMEQLIKAILTPKISTFTTHYDRRIEDGVGRITPLLPDARISKKSLALMLLAGDESLNDWLHKNLDETVIREIDNIRHEVQSEFSQSLGYAINHQRLRAADKLLSEVFSESGKRVKGITSHIGRWSMDPVWGVPFLLAVLYGFYQFVGVFGAGTLVNFLEKTVFNGYLNPWITRLFDYVPIPLVRELFVGPYGIITMALTYAIAIVLPIVGTFFIAFGIMEDSGYLPRLAVMVNKIFKAMGLNGKAVLPMVLGLGCDTMATLTTRILETRKERIIVTLLLALGVPCSAQMGVVLGMLGSVSFTATLIWLGVVISVLLLVGYLASKIIPGAESDFILELPPIRLPQLSNIGIKTMARIEWYLREAVPLFILGTLILFVSDKLGLLTLSEKIAEPLVVGFLGLPIKATEAFIIGFLRRDYGAAGLLVLTRSGQMDSIQVVVSLVTITLFVPCIANFFMIIKEQGLKVAL
ncbi:MAG: ferrous iron transport protein B, partial [Deltaproteobacteria bacterium]